ncbi:MAG: flagellar biosynthesis anti-sigma factor FlgM [Clostridium sp.]
MNIKGINTHRVNSAYQSNRANLVNKANEVKKKDSIEISSLGKSLTNYAVGDKLVDNTKKIEEIKSKIQNGTYNVDAKLTAQKMIDYIKGKNL